MKTTVLKAMTAAVALGLSAMSYASPLTCTDPGANSSSRSWTWNSATACGTVVKVGNFDQVEINSLGGVFSDAWVYNGEITSGGDTSSGLNISIANGSWGNKPVSGSWTLSANFWNTVAKAVVTIHNGGGNTAGLNDHGVFLLTAADGLNGVWSFTQTGGNGGGLSNFKLWTIAKTPTITTQEFTPPTSTPEPGSLLLLGSALAGLGLRRRKTQG